MKHKLLLAILITNFILVSCNSNTIEQTSNNTNSKSSSYSKSSDSWKISIITNNETWVTVKNIKIDSKCIWCGKCARMDSVHFQMNYDTHKAEPIQASWNESELEHAMNCCHVWAISVS